MTKRIFIAIDISDEARRLADAYVQNLRGEFRETRVGWEKREKLHLTVRFLGEIDEGRLKSLFEAVAEVARLVPPFRIEILKTRQFGKRVLWLGVSDRTASLTKIHELLEEKFVGLGFPRETKPFSPHLTIGRLREPNRAGDLVRKHLQNPFAPVSFEVRAIVIYESILGPGGSKYQRIGTLPLDPAASA